MNEAFDFGGRVWGSCTIKDIVESVAVEKCEYPGGGRGASGISVVYTSELIHLSTVKARSAEY